jgi:hypothetical protein
MKFMLTIILNVAVGQNVQSVKIAVGQKFRRSKWPSVKNSVGQKCRWSKWPSVKAASVKRPGTYLTAPMLSNLDSKNKTTQVTINIRMISPFQLCFLQFAQAIVLFQG